MAISKRTKRIARVAFGDKAAADEFINASDSSLGDMLAANNLSELTATAATARANIAVPAITAVHLQSAFLNTSAGASDAGKPIKLDASGLINANMLPPSGVTDHGALTGLGDDDHAQYHTDARGDIRYYTKTQLNGGQLDNRYFRESEFLVTSVGAGDSGKPIKLDAAGNIDATMINDGDIDHGSIGGLADDDHAQYHTDSRGDARYYTKTQLDGGQLDNQYFQESEFTNTSAGASDAGKPVKLDAAGLLNANMLPSTGDNLGNHTATQNLDMAGNDITSASQFSVITNSNTNVTFNANGSLNFDGADFVGPTSGPSLSIIVGSPIPGLTAGGVTVFGMRNGTSISGAGNAVSQMFGSENLLALVTPPTASTVAGQNIGNNLTTLVNSQLIGVGVINKVQSVTDSYISGRDAGAAANLGGTSWDNVILIGRNAGTTNDYGAASSLVAFGRGGIFSTFDSPTGEIMFGSSGQTMPDMYLGEGAGSTSPSTDVRIQPTGAIGGTSTDLAATGRMILAGARGTGTEDGSDVLIQTAPGGSTGTTLNTLITRMRFLVAGGIEFKTFYASTEQLVAMTADNQSVTATQSMMRVTSNNVTATNRTMDLQNGTTDGQVLVIICDTPTNAFEILNTGNRSMAGDFTSTDNSTISFIWNASTSSWHETSRSAN